MGLLEKAYEYKKEMNRQGRNSLIDDIIGPAETEEMPETAEADEDIPGSFSEDNFLDEIQLKDNNFHSDKADLFELPEEDNSSPLDALNEQKHINIKYDDVFSDDKTESENKTVKFFDANDNNPLTLSDEPVLPIDIDSDNRQQKEEKDVTTQNEVNFSDAEELNNFDLPDIEPEIIPDNNFISELPGSANDPVNNISSEHEYNDYTDRYTGNSVNNKKFISDDNLQNTIALNEILKEITRSETRKTLFEVIIFFMMGQIGTNSASVLIKDKENSWIIADSSGLKSSDLKINFASDSGIFKIIRKDIIDVKEYTGSNDFPDDTQKLNLISSRLLIPWTFKGKLICVLSLGNKIIDEDYSENERELLLNICEAAAVQLNVINTSEKLNTELKSVKTELDFLNRINSTKEGITGESSISQIKTKLNSLLKDTGLMSYSFFLYFPVAERYIPVINENEDFLTIEESEFFIDEKNPFIRDILNRKNNPVIDNFNESDSVREAFGDLYRKKMSLLWIFPFTVNDNLIGFASVYKIKEELLFQEDAESKRNEIFLKLRILTNSVIHILNNINDINQRIRYIDNTGYIIKRINTELNHSKALNIPLSLIVFSIKNFKRYTNIFGFEKSKELINSFLELIKTRISDTEFYARFSTNKILILLPGKDKKYAAPFANVIRNEFIQRFKKSEMQLLITFLITEYPEDGDDILSITENID